MKYCPAPRSEAHTHRLRPVSTHLSFRWTLPLRQKKSKEVVYIHEFNEIMVMTVPEVVFTVGQDLVRPKHT
jgi:hypothetical protein